MLALGLLTGALASNTTSLAPAPHWVLAPAESEIHDVAAGDLDGDGADDIVSASRDAVGVFSGGPYGLSMLPSPSWSTGTWPTVAVADLSGDGIDDLVIGDPYANNGGGALKIHLGDLAGLSTVPSWEVAGTEQLGLRLEAPGDLDGDGFADLLVGEGQPSLYTFRWWRGTASGLEATDWIVAGWHLAADVGDVNRDGHLDLIVASTQNDWIDLYLGSSSGPSPTPAWSATADGLWGVLLADTTGAGNADLLALHGYTDAQIAIYPSDGATFATEPTDPIPMPGDRCDLSAGRDLDGDGTDEIVLGLNDQIWVLDAESLPAALAGWPAPYLATSTAYTVVEGANAEGTAADFDGDGALDLLLATSFAWDAGGATSYGHSITDTDALIGVWYAAGLPPDPPEVDTGTPDTGTPSVGTTDPTSTSSSPATEPEPPEKGDDASGCGCAGPLGETSPLALLVPLLAATRRTDPRRGSGGPARRAHRRPPSR